MSKRTPVVRAGPKRRIETFESRVEDANLDTAVTQFIIHTAEDAKTLVRTIISGKLLLHSGVADALYDCDLLLEVQPGAVSIGNPTTSQVLDQPKQKQTLWRYTTAFEDRTLAGPASSERIHVDLKSMRKLSTGDRIVLETIASTANVIGFFGWIVQFFKE